MVTNKLRKAPGDAQTDRYRARVSWRMGEAMLLRRSSADGLGFAPIRSRLDTMVRALATRACRADEAERLGANALY